MISLLFDENFDRRILRGLRLRIPTLEYVIAQETSINGATDPVVLGWAAENGRIVVTHDISGADHERFARRLMKEVDDQVPPSLGPAHRRIEVFSVNAAPFKKPGELN